MIRSMRRRPAFGRGRGNVQAPDSVLPAQKGRRRRGVARSARAKHWKGAGERRVFSSAPSPHLAHHRMAALVPAASRERAGAVPGSRVRREGKKKGRRPFRKASPLYVCYDEDVAAQAFFSGRKEARMPRARKPTTTLRETMAGRWITPATSSSILAPMKARMAMTDLSRWRR